ncbi:hypothetical protein ES703_78517 [subsurface metagenome]
MVIPARSVWVISPVLFPNVSRIAASRWASGNVTVSESVIVKVTGMFCGAFAAPDAETVITAL